MSRSMPMLLAMITSTIGCGISEHEGSVTREMVGRPEFGAANNTVIYSDSDLSLTGVDENQLMTYRGGEVIRAPITTYAIFWGKEWTTPSYAGDKIGGINRLLAGIGDSAYLGIVNEYGGTSKVRHIGHMVDSSTFPTGDINPNQAAAAVCRNTKQNPVPTTTYFVYGTKKAKANICATHGWGQCANGKKFLMAWFPDIDEPKCFTPDRVTKNSQGLKNLANATAHELAEIITDPRRGGWFDNKRAEIADKCAWIFPAGNVSLTNGSSFRLINLWSNRAYRTNQGTANSSQLRGCVASRSR